MLTIFLNLTLSCEPAPLKSELLITATQQGSYQIYHEPEEKHKNLLAKKIGIFNRKTELPPGIYTLSTECSQTQIKLKANEFKTLKAYEIEFIPPDKNNQGNLVVECRGKLGNKRNKKFISKGIREVKWQLDR